MVIRLFLAVNADCQFFFQYSVSEIRGIYEGKLS